MTAANGRSIRRAKLRKVAKVASDAQGCTCRPDVTVGAARGFDNVKLFHDRWCPLYNYGRVWVVYDEDQFSGCSQ
jgi:hypothetical protein